MNQKNSNQVMNVTQITVLTPGLGSNAGTWSNHFSKENKEALFAYDSDSIISKISEKVGGANIYWARMTKYTQFNLYNITNEKSTTENFDINSLPLIYNITDVSKHIIIIFDSLESYGSNNNLYYQLNYVLSKIIYDVKIANGGKLPKINLIGHSRGGLTNLQYALDHPDLVSTLISLGTPYFGSTTARLFGEMVMDGPSDGLDDILNPEIYYGYNTRWNDNYNTLYKDIKAYAVGSYHTLFSIPELLINDYSGYLSNELKAIISLGIVAINNLELKSIINFPVERLVSMFITEILDATFPGSSIVDAAEILLQEINLDKYPMFVSWYNDILVPLESQLANDSGSIEYGGGAYLGFTDIIRPFLVADEYVNYEKVSQATVPVGHNLVARDRKVISEILNVLDLGVNENSAYITEENEDGTLTFVRYNGEYSNSTFIIPETIGGKTVTAIGSYALSEGDNITEIQIPKTVKKIGAYAFTGLTDLTTITFYGSQNLQLEKIGYGAFSGCTSLNKFNAEDTNKLIIPSSVTFIDCYAFYGTAFSTVNMGSEIYHIGDVAFSNMPNLTAITITGNSNYMTQNGVLYNADGWLMQYPVGNSASSFSIPQAVNGKAIRHISQFAFAGEDIRKTKANG